MFIDEGDYESSSTEFTLIKELYIEYRSFCHEDGFKPVNKTNFRQRLEGYGIVVKRRNVGNVAFLSR